LTGRAPFVGKDQGEIWDRARRCDFDAEALRAARVPRRLERICLKAMAADPAERYATAEEMGRVLERFLGRPRQMGIAAVVLLAAALLSAFSLRPAGQQRSVDPGSDAAAASAVPQVTPLASPTRPAPLRGGITLWVDEPGST